MAQAREAPIASTTAAAHKNDSQRFMECWTVLTSDCSRIFYGFPTIGSDYLKRLNVQQRGIAVIFSTPLVNMPVIQKSVAAAIAV
jgi:hypothetical protein